MSDLLGQMGDVASDMPTFTARRAYDREVRAGYGRSPWDSVLSSLGYDLRDQNVKMVSSYLSTYLMSVSDGNYDVDGAWGVIRRLPGMQAMPDGHAAAVEDVWKRQARMAEEDVNEFMNKPEMVVHLLLDGVGDAVELEFAPSNIDTMPHVTWMIRALGSDQTQYLAKGVAHDKGEAQRQADEKVRLLGVRVSKVNDRTQHPVA